MSKQLAVSAAFSVLMMASYVLFGADASRESLAPVGGAITNPVEISAPGLPMPSALLPFIQ